MPVATPTRWSVSPVTTSTPKPPPARASRAFTGTAKTLSARWVVMLTFTGAWSSLASSGVLSRVTITVTVGVELLPVPPDEQGDWPAEPAPAPPPAPMPPPPGQVATLPTVSMRPPTVDVPLGNTTDTASPGFTRYSSETSRSTVTMGVVLVAVSTVPPPPPPTDAPTDGVTDVTRRGPGSNTTPPSRISPVAGRPSASCQRATAPASAGE